MAIVPGARMPAKQKERFAGTDSTVSNAKAVERRIVANAVPADMTPRAVAAEFRKLLAAGGKLNVDGTAKSDPALLLRRGYVPRFIVDLFGTRFYLCNLRHSHDLKLMPAYVQPAGQRGKAAVFARVFYKDSSLVWRAASHYINTAEDQWIGKGAVKWYDKRGEHGWVSAEETTNLPFEMQAALDDVSQRSARTKGDRKILFLILRNAPANRIRPYHSFESPRAKAMGVPANRINDNAPISWFEHDDDPRSLKFEPGFEPDFKAVIDVSTSQSYMYGGQIEKYRIASRNRLVQYLFVEGPKHVWLIHPQSVTTELSTFGLRTIEVNADEDMGIPGYEFADHPGFNRLVGRDCLGCHNATPELEPGSAELFVATRPA